MLGKFITIEGVDGSGKTTITHNIKEYLEQKGYEVILTREPGGSEVSEKIRNIILSEDIDIKTEVLLFAASRREHILKTILPAVKQGKIVICDRFLDSSIAYQAFGRKLNIEDVLQINDYILDGLEPDKTFLLNVNLEVGLERTKGRLDNNRLDNEKIDFYLRVLAGYDYIEKKYANRVVKIDANQEIENVKTDVISELERFLANGHNRK